MKPFPSRQSSCLPYNCKNIKERSNDIKLHLNYATCMLYNINKIKERRKDNKLASNLRKEE